MQAFVPKNRRPRFDLVLRIIDINNVPLSKGVVFVRWRLPSSSATEHHGTTEKATLLDHQAYWNYEKALQVRLTIDRTSMLQECELHFEVIQEFGSSSHADRNLLGKIKLNLAEYVDKVEEDEGVVRRYLMFESKVNSTLKIGIAMRQVEGDRNFTTPALKSATVFGGIAGVVHSSEPDAHDELGQLPAINVQSREVADMQDMYRRTLAASWTSRAGDLPADKLVEELFAGSSCWNNKAHNPNRGAAVEDDHADSFLSTEAAERQNRTGKRLSPSLSFEKRPKSASNHSHSSGKTPESLSTLGHGQMAGSIEQQIYDGAKGRGWRIRNSNNELSEFDVREDLRSWEVASNE
ncbi:hypothetical protein N7474_004339 [Penicillium riverlandense]|uniref:uncharacterized protein n=1 Tax=Penicillium riverlandense TaxID=1903569 RepID=UPI00254914BC|nr:uncharacterized protein N7474_004339 [Penicillium riverlandense]KAJ5818748.1 hypothetical protein N7474_004339 [Penicillium riverlandense]